MWAHSLSSCPLPGPASLSLSALGDFPISNRTSEYLSLDAAGTKLAFPESTLALEASASIAVSEQPFVGYAERGDQRFDFLLWPEGTACDVFRAQTGDSFPGKLGGEALGYAGSAGLVLVAGSNDATSAAIVGALTFDARTGESHVVDPRARAVLSEPRAFASVTDFSGAVLVAGGENPIHDAAQPATVLRDTAEVYDPATQSFEPTPIQLAEGVTHHTAVALRGGETALFGGRNEAALAANVVQVVSPVTRLAKLVEPLAQPRNSPIVIRLDDDRVLIAGGTDEDGHAVGALEWRDVDASSLAAPFDGSVSLPARFERAFVALPGGAALAVGGCEDRKAKAGEDCSACLNGCPANPDPASQQSYDAFWLGPDGSVKPLDFPLVAPHPLLLPGSDGRPWLFSGDANGSPLYRFDPWQRRFDAVDLDLNFDTTIDPARIVATGPDAFVWLGADEAGPFLRGARLGTRSEFASDIDLVSLSEAFVRPAHLAPDHVTDGTVSYDAAAGTLSFTTAAETPTCVWVADAKYGDFSAEITFSTEAPPALRLGATAIDVSAPCAPPALPAGEKTLSVRRTGAQLTLSASDAKATCELADATTRMPFAACQTAAGATAITNILITRGD